MPCVCLSLRNALERVRNAAYWGQRIQTAVLSCPAKRMSEVAIGMRAVQAYSSKCIGRVAVGGSGLDTRGPGPGLRRAGRQTDRAGAKERYAPAQLLRSSRARQTGHSNGEARQGRDDSSAGNRPPFHAACRSSSSSCAKQAKNDGYSPATAPRCRLRQKKPGRLDKPRVHWPWEIAMGLGV